jgi:hypothetical protein
MEQLLQYEIEAIETYCNISSSTTATLQKHLLQQPKKILIATFEIIYYNIKKNHCNTARSDPNNSPEP